MHNYHLDRGTPRCAFKVDIQKAYDTVDWEFCEIHHGLVHARHDCLDNGVFCSKLELINLCFADDLFLFAYGDVHSASIIKEALEEFKGSVPILTPSLPKSWHISGSNSNPRLEKQDTLSALEHLQLIRSVLGVMHIYWASVFILPSRVLLNIEQLEGFFMDFWDIPLRGNVSWGWRKILHLCPTISEFIWCNLGEGAATSLWFDNGMRWSLANRISSCDNVRAGLLS
ncbi:hypothetical protein Tco_0620590 [Tanacetum coccineum]